MFIAIEGMTNSGKTSLCKFLRDNNVGIIVNDYLKNDVVYQKVSSITHPIKNKNILDEKTELFLYLTQLSRKVSMIKKINAPVVISDRYCLSLYSYFISVLNQPEIVTSNIIEITIDSLVPDVTIILDSKYETIERRSRTSKFSRKDLSLSDTFDKQRQYLLSGVSRFSVAHEVFDSNLSFDDVCKNVMKYLEYIS